MLERVAGIEPASSAWKAEVLPLNYARLTENTQLTLTLRRLSFLVERAGFEPAKLSRQIYSLIPLAAREPLRKMAGYCADASYTCQQNTLFKGRKWSWREESNPRPADYKSAALPTELHQHNLRPLNKLCTERGILVNVYLGSNLVTLVFP